MESSRLKLALLVLKEKQGPDLRYLRRTNWRGKLLLGFGMLIFGTHGILNSISTSLEHPTVSTLLEHPKYGCSHEVLFLAFLALKMAFKVNFDPTIRILMSNMSSMPSFRSFGGLIMALF